MSAQAVRNCLREAHLHAHHPHRGLNLTAVRHLDWLEWANAQIRWCLALWRGVLFTEINLGFHCTGQMADSVYGVCVGEWCADVNNMDRVDRVAHGGGGVMAWTGICMDKRTQVHFLWHFECTETPWRDLRSIVEPFIHDHHLMLQHDNHGPMLQGSVHNSWKLKTSQFLHGQHSHRTCHPLSTFGMLWISVYDSLCYSSCQYPATSHSHWRGVDQNSTCHNQQPDQLYAKLMCCITWGKWWSHQILTGFWTPQYSKTADFKVAFYCGQPKAHLCNNHTV